MCLFQIIEFALKLAFNILFSVRKKFQRVCFVVSDQSRNVTVFEIRKNCVVFSGACANYFADVSHAAKMHPPTGRRCRQISDANETNTSNNSNAITMMEARRRRNKNNTAAANAATITTTTTVATKTFGYDCRQLSVLLCFVAIVALNNFGCLLTTTTAATQRENMRVLPLPEGK